MPWEQEPQTNISSVANRFHIVRCMCVEKQLCQHRAHRENFSPFKSLSSIYSRSNYISLSKSVADDLETQLSENSLASLLQQSVSLLALYTYKFTPRPQISHQQVLYSVFQSAFFRMFSSYYAAICKGH